MRVLGWSLFIAGLATSPVAADALTFSADLAGVCALSLPLSGTMKLSADGTILGSGEGGLPATVVILSVGTNTIDVGAPTLTDSPVGYSQSGQSVEVAYTGLTGLSAVDHSTYTSSASSFTTGTIPASILQVQNRIVNENGFEAGHYGTQTVVTCE